MKYLDKSDLDRLSGLIKNDTGTIDKLNDNLNGKIHLVRQLCKSGKPGDIYNAKKIAERILQMVTQGTKLAIRLLFLIEQLTAYSDEFSLPDCSEEINIKLERFRELAREIKDLKKLV